MELRQNVAEAVVTVNRLASIFRNDLHGHLPDSFYRLIMGHRLIASVTMRSFACTVVLTTSWDKSQVD